jgi:hypothetical protein
LNRCSWACRIGQSDSTPKTRLKLKDTIAN